MKLVKTDQYELGSITDCQREPPNLSHSVLYLALDALLANEDR